MIDKSNFCPSYLKNTDDFTHAISKTPLWSENYLSTAAFPKAGVFLWLHHGRPVYDAELWQEIFVVYLPGDKYLVSKATALRDTTDGPRAAGLTYECIKPFELWKKSFRGAARIVTGDELRAGAMRDGLAVGVKMELIYRSLGSAFDMDLTEQVWTTNHYQQNCAVEGFLEYGGKRIELTGSGIRDHSWGPRDYSRVGRHCWLLAQWESGRSFMIFHLVSSDGSHTLSHVTIDDGSGLVGARLVSEAPLISDIEGGSKGYVLRIELPTKKIIEITAAEIIQVPMLSMTGQAELTIGADQTDDSSHWLCESATRFVWDGESGYGLSERTVRRNF